MAEDGHIAGSLPVSLKVKNTFLVVNSSFAEDDADDVAFPQNSLRKRQVSEPVPSIQRQISGGPFHRAAVDVRPPVSGGLQHDGLLEEEELEGDEFDELDDSGEPEREEDPSWTLGRQETELAWPTTGPMRQETEQCWPSWRPQATGAPGAAPGQEEPMLVRTRDEGSAPGMWMYNMPGVEGESAPQADMALAEGALPHAALAGLCPPPWPPWPVLADPFAAVHGSEGGVPGEGLPGLEATLPGAFAHSAGEHGGAAAELPLAPEPPLTSLAGAAMDGLAVPPPEWASTSTVMMRNLPNKYTQQMLLEDLNQAGYQGTFDFMYLPIDPETRANRGYAFINFVDPTFSWMLKMTYEGRKMSRFNSDKLVSVTPAALQGFEANHAHYSAARVNRGDPAARPLFLCEPRSQHLAPKQDGGRRRGGRRSAGSLIDLAARQQQQQQQRAAMAAVAAASPMQWHAGSAVAAALGGGAPPGAGHAGGAAKGAATRAGPKFCPYCGGSCQPQFRFCQFCGASLDLGV